MAFNYKKFIKLLGPKTYVPKPKGKILNTKIFKKYILQTVEYNVEKNERVKSFLLKPKNFIKKFPVIICHHQHASKYTTGKSEIAGIKGNKDLFYAKELAELGFITLAPDSIAFEDRNKCSNNWWGSEYFELATRIIRGKNLLEKLLSDLSASINYLETRKDVEKSKIGFIGHSYGGRMAILFPAYDKRIKVSVSNCYCRNIKNSLNFNSNARIPMELVIPGLLKNADFQDFVKLVHPCHLLISAAKNDKWSQDANKIYKVSKKYFKKAELKLKIWRCGHRFSKKMRIFSYNFIKEKLSLN